MLTNKSLAETLAGRPQSFRFSILVNQRRASNFQIYQTAFPGARIIYLLSVEYSLSRVFLGRIERLEIFFFFEYSLTRKKNSESRRSFVFSVGIIFQKMRISNRKREIRRNIFLFEVSVKSNSHDKRKNAEKKTSVLITLLNSIKFASLIDELIVPNLKKKKGIKEATRLRTNFSKY